MEQLTHPEIGRRLQQQSEAMAASGTPAAVLDAPLLLESGWDKLCEELIFVDAPVDASERANWQRPLSRRLDDVVADSTIPRGLQELDEARGPADRSS